MKLDLQRSGYSMEYHGKHYFFNIKNSVSVPGRFDVSILFNFAQAT